LRRSLPRLEQIESFIEAANAPSFRVAAERCALSAAALSRRVQAFSDHFGQQLFERTAAGARLTEAGRQCLAELEPAYLELRQASLRVGQRGKGTVNLSMSHSLAVCWLIPRLPDFRAQHPEIDLTLKIDRGATALQRGDADIGICFSDIEMKGMIFQKLLPVHTAPVATPAFAKSFNSLKGQPLLSVTMPADIWPWWAEASGQAEPDGPITRFEFTHAMYEAAAQGIGIAMGSSPTIWPFLESGRLIRLDFPVVDFHGFYSVVTTPARAGNRNVAATWRWLEKQAAMTPALH
jgi:LysR family glycine cleavage system transcriptional activator